MTLVPTTILWSLLAAGLSTDDGPALGDPTPLILDSLPAGWTFLQSHSDEFDGATLDDSRWQVDVPHWGLWSWRRDNVHIAGGHLRLTMTAEDHLRAGKALHYTAGIVRSRAMPLRYAYVEARIRAAPRWPGVASAFWLFRNTGEYWTEIDVVEMMQRRSARNIIDFSHYVLRGDTAEPLPVRRKSYREVDWDPAADFHVYSALWTQGTITYYVDGRPMGRFENTYWHQPMDLVLSLGLRAPLDVTPSPQDFPTSMVVDYVRCWGPSGSGSSPQGAGMGPRLDWT